MPPQRRHAAGSFTATATTTKIKKAKNSYNQTAMERLQKARETPMAQNSHYSLTLKRAMDSLAKCPHAITTRKQALELKFVGPSMAKIIVTSHEEKEAQTLSRSSSINSTASSNNSSINGSTTTTTVGKKNGVKSKPKKRMKQTTLLSQDEASFTDSSSVSLKPPPPSAKQIAYSKAVQEGEEMVLRRSGWKAILLLDKREQRRDHVQAKLQMSGVPCEQRHLPIGDMAWIARSGSQEIMLGTIIERKQAADLASSLFGTRYLEQRLRLQHCGLNQVLLLVEGDVNAVANCPGDTLRMAMMETRVQLGFQVVQTKHLEDTVRFLKRAHRRIFQRSFPAAFGQWSTSSLPSFRSPNATPRPRKKKKRSLVDMIMDIPPIPPCGAKRFVTYNELKARVERDREMGTRTVHAIHMAMLKQIPTFSLKKVQAIGQAYPTPSALIQAFDGLSDEDGKGLVKDLSTNNGAERTCRIGPKSAVELYHVYGGPAGLSLQSEAMSPVKQATEPCGAAAKSGKRTPKRSNVASMSKIGARETTPTQHVGLKTPGMWDSDDSDTCHAEHRALTTPVATSAVAAMPNKDEWSCTLCTLGNSPESACCEVCEAPRTDNDDAEIPTTVTASDPSTNSWDSTKNGESQDSFRTSDGDRYAPCARIDGADSSTHREFGRDTPNSSLALNTSTWSNNDTSQFDWAFNNATPCQTEEKVVDLSRDKDGDSVNDEVTDMNVNKSKSPPPLATQVVYWSDSPTDSKNSQTYVENRTVRQDATKKTFIPGVSNKCDMYNGSPVHKHVDGSPENQEKEGFVTLYKAPWDGSSSDESNTVEEESLFARCQKRGKALNSTSEHDAKDRKDNAPCQGARVVTEDIENGEPRKIRWKDCANQIKSTGLRQGKHLLEDSCSSDDEDMQGGSTVSRNARTMQESYASDDSSKADTRSLTKKRRASTIARETTREQPTIEVIEID